jgi:hypothetical protein
VPLPVAFTKIVDVLPQLYFYSGTEAQSKDQYTRDTNFSTFLMGGLILKGGVFSATVNSNAVTYSTLSVPLAAFPNNTLAVFFTNKNTTNGRASNYNVTAMTSTGFTVTITANAGANFDIMFVAIGY